MAIEVDNGNYAGRTCKCRFCKRESVASFVHDYYPTDEKDQNGKHYLMCESCMMRKALEKPEIKTTAIQERWDDI